VGHVAHMVEMRNAYKVLVRRSRCRWEYNIMMDLNETGWEVVLDSSGSR
jgi:hypothetical protein